MPFVPNLSTPYLQSTLELCFGDADNDAGARQDLLSQFSGVYANIGRSLYNEWMGILQRDDDKEAHDLLAFALNKRPPMPPAEALLWLRIQFKELAPLWQLLGCESC